MNSLLILLFCAPGLSAPMATHADFMSAIRGNHTQGFEYRDATATYAPSVESLVPSWTFDTDAPVLSAINIADVDGDSIADVLLTTYGQGPNPYASGHIYVLDIDGHMLPGWPKQTGAPFAASCVAGDIDGDGAIELVSGDWSAAYAWEGDGTPLVGWPRSPGTYSTPALADLDKDGDLEVVYSGTDNRLYVWHEDGSSMPGWPVTAPELVGPPAVADLDNDDTLEVVGATYQGPVGPDSFEIYAWEADGLVITGFPVWTSGVNKAAPAIGDIDLDGVPEIVISSYHTSNLDFIYAFDGVGSIEPGWPIRADYVRLSSPALGDIDGDSDLEVFCGGYDPTATREKMFAFHHNGSPVAGWPVILNHPGASGNINGSVIIGDIDGVCAPYATYWPVYKHDAAGTGSFPVGGMGFNEPEVLVKVVDHVFAMHPDGGAVSGFPFYLDDENHTGTHSPSPAVADMDRDGDAELVCASSSGMVALLDLEPTGVVENKRPSETPVYPELKIVPNPFAVCASIAVTRGSSIEVYDVAGRRVNVSLSDRGLWYGYDDSGSPLPGGIYFVVAANAAGTNVVKVAIMR